MAPSLAAAQSKLKVAAIYTVPFEQQWVSRIHKALKAAEARGEIEYKASENVSNADYERVMREYATGGNQLILGEAFAVEAAARKDVEFHSLFKDESRHEYKLDLVYFEGVLVMLRKRAVMILKPCSMMVPRWCSLQPVWVVEPGPVLPQ